MPNGLRNWAYKDVIHFLEENGFSFSKCRIGSHEVWLSKRDGKDFMVEVNKTSSSYPPRTLETMIRQSGFDKKFWRNWQG